MIERGADKERLADWLAERSGQAWLMSWAGLADGELLVGLAIE
jgi:hypothetical protein